MIALILNVQMPSEEIQAPPGTKKVNDSLYLDINLLSVEGYKEFLYFIKIDTGLLGIDYRKCIPDSTIKYLGEPYLMCKRYKEDYPILNLDEYQIDSYCRWRSYVVNLMKNNYDLRCNHESWDKFDIGDPLRIYEVEYTLADSVTINLYKPSKRINVPEKFRNEKSTTIKYLQKHFDKDVVGFRCKAKYILRK